MSRPEIALLLSTYQRPEHLRRALLSIALQEDVSDKFELVVTDDGSTDETASIVAEFAKTVPFPVGFTTHPHTTFRLSRCRNEGVRASTAPYLLFLDGDCILPRNHVRVHLQRRRPGVVMAGDCCRLEESVSAGIGLHEIRAGNFERFAGSDETRRLAKLDRSSRFYRLIRHPTKPKLIGNNVGIWRSDYERINGYDENFQGWGCEDDDLRYRLRQSGVVIESILRWTRTYHLWHPQDVTAPGNWKKGANVAYLLRRGRLTRCLNGLSKRRVDELAIKVVGHPTMALANSTSARSVALQRSSSTHRPEVEILVLPGEGRFSGQAECNVLVALVPEALRSRAARGAHLTIEPPSPRGFDYGLQFPWHEFEQALGKVA